MTSMDWAYIAGFFDGEGCVGKYAHFHVSLVQAEPQELVIYKIADFLTSQGLRPTVSASNSRRIKGHNRIHRVEMNRQSDVKVFLEGVLPYLIVKREKAEQILAQVDERLTTRNQPHWRSSLHAIPEREVRRVWRLWKSGTTQEEIGRMLGISQKQVSTLFKIRCGQWTIPA